MVFTHVRSNSPLSTREDTSLLELEFSSSASVDFKGSVFINVVPVYDRIPDRYPV